MWFIVLLGGLFGASVMGAESCFYRQEIFSNPIQVFSPGYPSNYPKDTNCLWEAYTLTACKLKLNCTEVEIPSTPVVGCTGDYIQVSPSGSTNFTNVPKHCGTKSFTVTSNCDQMTIKLSSNNKVLRGKFLCTIQAISDTRICEVDNSTSVKNILDLRGEEKMHFLNSFDIFMTDCDGTIWPVESGQIQDSGKALNELESLHKKVIYVSNNSIRTEKEYEKKIKEIGATYRSENLVYPLKMIIYFLKKTHFSDLIYFIGSNNALKLLRDAGFNVITGPNGQIEENFSTLIHLAQDNKPVQYVIMDFDFNFSYAKFLKATTYLRDPECQLIFAASDYNFPLRPGYSLSAQGYFQDDIEDVMPAGKESITLGKPGVELGILLQEIYKINNPRRVLFVGDMLYPDIKMAHNNGYQSLLVLTGGTTKQDMIRNKDNSTTPDYYAESIGDIAKVIQSVRGQ